MRLFIAVRFPEHVLDALCRRQERLRAAAAQGNFSRRENLHLTLAFLGDVPPSGISRIRKAMDAAAGPAFSITIGGPGRFRGGRGDTLWLGIDAPPALYTLQDRLAAGLADAGFRLEDRPFTPHLTIARTVILRPGQELRRLCAADAPVSCPVHAISLMRSERIGGVLTYTEIYGKELVHGGEKQPACTDRTGRDH